MQNKCNKRVYERGWNDVRGHECGRPVVEDGKCKIHCYSVVSARRAKSEKKYQDKVEAERRRNVLRYASPYIDALRICEYALEQYLIDGSDINREGLQSALKKAKAALKDAP